MAIHSVFFSCFYDDHEGSGPVFWSLRGKYLLRHARSMDMTILLDPEKQKKFDLEWKSSE